jgi:hypothetical protein
MRDSMVDTELAKRIELAKREWETTVDTIAEGLALFDATSLEIRRVNWPFARIFSSTPKKMVGINVHKTLCNCKKSDCQVRKFLMSTSVDLLEVRNEEGDHYWHLGVYPISAISGSRTHFHHNVVVMRDITEERTLQRRIIEAEKHAYMVELVDHLIDRVNPSVDNIREELGTMKGHLVALREVLRRAQGIDQENGESSDSGGYPDLAYKEIEQAMHQSQEELDRINEVIGCLDELEISTGQVHRPKLNLD